jgi:hypothetical protein
MSDRVSLVTMSFLTAEAYGFKLNLEGWSCGCGFAVSFGSLVE